MSEIPHTEHQGFRCPECGTVLDSTTTSQFEAKMPKEGDFSLCVGCLAVNIFQVSAFGVSLRRATPEEHVAFEVDHGHVRDVLRSIKEAGGEG